MLHTHTHLRRRANLTGCPISIATQTTCHQPPVSLTLDCHLTAGCRFREKNPAEAVFGSSPILPVYSRHTPSRPSAVQFPPPRELVSASDFPSTPTRSRLAESSELRLIREARLCHFAQNSSPVAAVHSRLSAPTNGVAPSSPIPDGAVCIDLTDD
jgi:hypothetical protein